MTLKKSRFFGIYIRRLPHGHSRPDYFRALKVPCIPWVDVVMMICPDPWRSMYGQFVRYADWSLADDRKRPGVNPTSLRNVVMNWLWLEKPHCRDTSMSEMSLSASSCWAYAIRL